MLLLAAAGCGSAPDTVTDTAPDAAGDVLAPPTPTTTGTVPPPPVPDAGADTRGASDAGADTRADTVPTVDAVRPPDATPIEGGVDAPTEAGALDSGAPTSDVGAIEASAPDARVDSVAVADAVATVDAVRDAAGDPVCPVPNAECKRVNDTDARVRATFPAPCSPELARQCGGVQPPPGGTVVETLPLVCRAGAWRLAGAWSGVQWVPYFECSRGCAEGMLCDP